MKQFYYAFAFMAFFFTHPSIAQTPSTDEKAILEVIDKLFIGLEKGDSTGLRTLFHSSVHLNSVIYTKNGQIVFEDDKLIDFFQQIAAPRKMPYKEQLLSKEVRIDGNLATVWTPYKFLVDGQVVSCGTNSFTLIKLTDTWVISAVIDTRRRTGCENQK